MHSTPYNIKTAGPSNAVSKPVLAQDRLNELTLKWMSPGNIAAGGAAAVGGIVGAQALDDDRPWYSRLIRGGIGTGLMYGGYRYLTDPVFRDTINGYGYGLYNLVSPYIQKGVDAVKPVFDRGMAELVGNGGRS